MPRLLLAGRLCRRPRRPRRPRQVKATTERDDFCRSSSRRSAQSAVVKANFLEVCSFLACGRDVSRPNLPGDAHVSDISADGQQCDGGEHVVTLLYRKPAEIHCTKMKRRALQVVLFILNKQGTEETRKDGKGAIWDGRGDELSLIHI